MVRVVTGRPLTLLAFRELSLSRKGKPLALKSQWGLERGGLAAQSVGLSYSTRF